MRKEVLRINNFSAQSEREGCLAGVSLNLYEGEVLGILGSPNSGKTLLLQMIAGKQKFDEGTLFLNEEIEDAFKLAKKGMIALVQHKSALVENLSVADNIFHIKKHRHVRFFTKENLYEKLAKKHLDEFEIDIAPGTITGTLSATQKCMVEILKAYIWGAKIILVDCFSNIHSTGEYLYLNDLLERMKKRGISFLVTDYQLQHLQTCSDRILILSKGKAIKIFTNKRRNQIDLSKVFTEIPQKKEQNRIEKIKEIVIEYSGICTNIFDNLSLTIYKGEIMAIVDFGGTAADHLFDILQHPRKAYGAKLRFRGKEYSPKAILKKVVFTDFASDNKIIPYMTLEDNLCLASFNRFVTGGFVDKKRQQFVKREFLEWYADYSSDPEEDCSKISRTDKTAIQMFRLKLQKPKAVFCLNPILTGDSQTGVLIRQSLLELSEAGTAVVILSDNLEQCNGLAERFLFIRDGCVQEEYRADELFA